MPDILYQFSDLPTNPASLCARLAISHPLVGRALNNADRDTHLRGGLRVLLKYRKLLVSLRDAGWAVLDGNPKELQRMRNCPPAMYVTDDLDEEPFPCDCNWFCPWCYGRWLKDIFATINRAIRPGDRLVWAVGRTYVKFRPDIRGVLRRHRRRAAKLLRCNSDCRGAIMSLTAEPYTRKGEKFLRISYRYVVLLPPGVTFDFVPSSWKNGRTHAKLNTIKLINILSRAFRYPEFLFRGDIDDVVAILNARRGLRLFESYGCLRSKKIEDGIARGIDHGTTGSADKKDVADPASDVA